AHSLEIGSCWIGKIWNNKDQIKRIFNLADNLEPVALLALGYPDEKPNSERASLEKLIIQKDETSKL
ncbi:MAG: hypothetical protein N2Z79_04115, partial [Candidatus Omnitrophica bacterium]|nr:hypothetical protein [Candidatus Omnitrophota bacterium]